MGVLFDSYAGTERLSKVIATFFLPKSYDLLTVGSRGFLLHWNCNLKPSELTPCEPQRPKNDDEDDEAVEDKREVEKITYAKQARHSLHSCMEGDKVSVTAAVFNAKTMLLVTGFSNGVFAIHEMPGFSLVQSLSVGSGSVGGLCMSDSGDWVGLGIKGTSEEG